MDRTATSIKNRLSLRPPQTESLDRLSQITSILSLKKGEDISAALPKIKELFGTCTDFERTFPSVCFSLATGVGKTRLMGAFISYLYLEKGIKNFFVLAPNLTIYNKLIEDFGNPSNPKYVFKGIGEFATNPPHIVNGDNYHYFKQKNLFTDVTINVFNISKINAESRKGAQPKIRRLSEYIGDSYFNYLVELPDLVLLMDESHHYRADRGMEVINELNPVLGLEVTATPITEQKGKLLKFKNVVYEYSLAKAIKDGFVKEPAVATRKNFDPSHMSPEDVDRIKLEDGIRIHEDTKVQLDIYARDSKQRLVKPFVLVVAKDTDHAKSLKEMISMPGFFNGYYADKVMEIHSNQTGSEKEENVAQLLTLESPDNKIEIVIHVNMLKEGWDVTNLYTIIPLRTAAAMTLREQTIGRGLRLPYGRRTGVPKVDKLTIIAHDKFQEIIDAANEEGSIIKRENIIDLDGEPLPEKSEVITGTTETQKQFQEEQKRIEALPEEQKQTEQVILDTKRALVETIFESPVIKSTNTIGDLKKPEVKEIVIKNMMEKISGAQQHLFAAEIKEVTEKRYNEIVESITKRFIEIPKVIVQPSGDAKVGFRDFTLNTKNLNHQPASEEILTQYLQSNKQEVVSGKGRIINDTPERIIVSELMFKDEIDYEEHSALLYKLAGDAVSKFKEYLKDDEIMNVCQFHKKAIGDYIYAQMMENFFYEEGTFAEPDIRPFTRIEDHNFSKETKDKLHDFKETIDPTNAIPSKVFTGFLKACHDKYKFESKTEKDLAIILENDTNVEKWLRPAHSQFQIYWGYHHKTYHPDFVVETKDGIFLVETKKAKEISSEEVQSKGKAALEYCKHATSFTQKNRGKKWAYILIPHDAVKVNNDFAHLAKSFLFS